MNNYYNENAKEFFEGTAYVDMSDNYKDFLSYVPKQGKILDAGCGSGRDSLIFIQKGYSVEAIDGSSEMCRLASEHIGQEVKHMLFQEVDFKEEFDGIWACASLLHVPSQELKDVLVKLFQSLKSGGAIYASFKYGDFEGERTGRYFHNLTEKKAEKVFTQAGFKVEKIWITGDVRDSREEEKWINVLALHRDKVICQ